VKKLSDLSTEEKIGQLLLVGFTGLEPDDHIKEMIEKYRVGNILLFGRNLANVDQVIKLNNNLQQLASNSGGVPLSICTDQEGGCTTRISQRVSLVPGNMALGAIDDEDAAYQHGLIQAKEMLALGINQNLGPVLDINMVARSPIIGPRAFGDTAERCARLGAALVKGLQDNGVNATIKHFPGQGAIPADTHHVAPALELSREELLARELLPFKQAIDVGAASIMTAHIKLPAYESADIPVTMSRAVLTDLLRGELGFEGVVMSDGLEMGAITKHFSIGEASVLGILAGLDILMVCHTKEEQLEALEAVIEAVDKGKIGMDRLDEAAGRVLAMKARVVAAEEIIVDEMKSSLVIGNAEFTEQCADLCARSITLLRNDEERLPLKLSEADKVVVVYSHAFDDFNEKVGGNDQSSPLGEALKKRHKNVLDIPIGPLPDEQVIKQLVDATQGAALIVVTTIFGHNIWGTVPNPLAVFDQEIELVKALHGTGVPLIAVSTRSPYDIMELPEVKTALAAYSWWGPSMEALAAVLFGEQKPQGKLPVAMEGIFERGHGLSY
jgi:beta-N-acetylhexosaminidase